MRPLLKLYIALVATATVLLLVHDLSVVALWPHTWSVQVLIALVVFTAVGDHLQFEVRRGWYTNASAVAHLAAVFLLPPGLAMAIAAMGGLVRAIRYPLIRPKALFNIASISLAVGVAAHLANRWGGPDRVAPDGALTDPLVAFVVCVTYCAFSAVIVAVAIGIDRRWSIREVTRGTLGVQTAGELGLAMVGAMLAAMLISAPNWAPMLLVPAGMLYVAKQAMDRADRRSRNLSVTSAVGRAVVGSLDPEQAFEAIAARGVLEGLKLDGIALLPIDSPGAFAEHVAAETDQPALRSALLEQLARWPRQIDLPAVSGRSAPHWVPDAVRSTHLAAAAIPFGTGTSHPVGGLIAWRELQPGRTTFFGHEEMLVLKTLADYAAVTLEAARLSRETARLHHEAGQAEARREVESLHQVARLKDEFLGQVSHELRTPLTIIHGYSELILDGLLGRDMPMLVHDSAVEIHSNSALMLRMVDDLLDTSRLDAGRIELKTAYVDVSSWLARVVTGFGQANPTHHLVPLVSGPLPTVNVDLDRLGQVMHNLLSNAARYSMAGTQIRVAAHAVAEALEIDVVDEGSGVEAEDCERIFEKFYRGKHGATLAVRGTGLGLAVARQLVEAHGGTIGVRSTVGQGSTFWIRLPVCRALPPAVLLASPTRIDPNDLALSA